MPRVNDPSKQIISSQQRSIIQQPPFIKPRQLPARNLDPRNQAAAAAAARGIGTRALEKSARTL